MSSNTSHKILPNLRQRLFLLFIILGLLFMALGYWGRWLSHPVAGLNVLGVDLPEYVKFVPEARYGIIPINRLVFFAMPVTLALGLILFASVQRPLPLWLRALAGLAAVPVALSMLPPAWTPGLLMTPEFRTQTLVLMALMAATFLIPLWHHLLPDRLRGLLLSLIALLPQFAFRAFADLHPALEKLYQQPLRSGAGYYFTILGMVLLVFAGLALTKPSQNRPSVPHPQPSDE